MTLYLVLLMELVFAQQKVKPFPAIVTKETPVTTTTTTTPTMVEVPPSQDQEKISLEEGKKLQREFEKAQKQERNALKHRHSMMSKELKASHKQQLKEWEENERQSRRKFFEENKEGVKRREYVKALLVRRKELVKNQKEELKQNKNNQQIELKILEKEHLQKRTQFRDFLLQGQRPPSQLWPGADR